MDRPYEIRRTDPREWAVWCSACGGYYRGSDGLHVTFTSRRMADQGAILHLAFSHRGESKHG